MPQYSLATGLFTTTTLPAQIGPTYNIGLGNGTQAYGYVLQNQGAQSTGFVESSDTTSKDALTQYSSGQLIDRDLAYFPRITDGDFSGGGYQEVWLDTTKYFDSDLDPRVPGYLQLRAQWTRVSKAGLGVGTNYQVITWNGDFWATFGETNGNIYSASAGSTLTPTGASVLGIDTDGTFLFAGTASAAYRVTTGGVWTTISTTLNGTAKQWWVINQGTFGYFLYYLVGSNSLYKIDLTAATPVAAASQPQIAVGSNAIQIIDLVAYQNGLAILTTDVNGPGFDVWFHDGTNMTRIVRVDGYYAQGMCSALGNLLVGAYAIGQITSPELMLVSGGSFQVVAKPGSPFPAASQSCLQPRAASQYVYWPIINQSLKGISAGKGVIVQYDVLSGAVTHLPNQDTTDFTTTGGSLRAVAVLGDSVASVYSNGTTGVIQYQLPAFGTLKYQTSGWLASSHIDFATPGITKRFRRIEVHHAPLAAGEQITVEAFVDTDPLVFSTSLTPAPSTATATNSTVGSSLTAMTFGADTVGKTLYFAIQLTAGTSQLTSPRVSYVSVEIGGTWVWEFDLDCTAKRLTLQQQPDQQGIGGKDLWFLIRNAYENGQNLTLYLAQSVSYTVAVESAKGSCVAYSDKPNSEVGPLRADQEWLGHVVLRQVA